MKTKLEMAHEYAVAMLKTPAQLTGLSDRDIAVAAFNLADAMQAEADKREKVEQSEHVFEAIDEWQPDWSQAPEWAVAWTYDKNAALWWGEVPEIHRNIWFIDGGVWQCADAPLFGYTGDWRNSLRKRPE